MNAGRRGAADRKAGALLTARERPRPHSHERTCDGRQECRPPASWRLESAAAVEACFPSSAFTSPSIHDNSSADGFPSARR